MGLGLQKFTGTLAIRERIAITEAIATVKLVDDEGEVLAATAWECEGVPSDFAVTIDPAVISNSDKLFWWAMLRTEAGGWGTLDLVKAASTPTELILTRVED